MCFKLYNPKKKEKKYGSGRLSTIKSQIFLVIPSFYSSKIYRKVILKSGGVESGLGWLVYRKISDIKDPPLLFGFTIVNY